MKKEIISWGKTSSKEVVVVDELSGSSSVLTHGNNNSYGDCATPYNSFSLQIEFINKDDGFFNPKITISELLNTKDTLIYGVPGRKTVTLGGALASDVHGKDSFWGGSFIKNIDKFTLMLPSNEIIECSRDKNQEIFYTSVGGYGLTGTITSIKLKSNSLKQWHNFESTTYKGIGIDNLLRKFTNNENEYSVAWIDLINKSYKWVFEVSKPNRNIKNNLPKLPTTDKEFKISLPFLGTNRFNLLQYVNSIFYSLNKNDYRKNKGLNEVFYPLGVLSDSRNLAKKRKIIQVQFSIPLKFESSLEMLINLLITDQFPIICSLKKTGSNETNLNLSFIQEGWTVAVDFAAESFNHDSIRNFYTALISCKGKVYLAKDSTLKEREFKLMYDNYPDWKNIVKKIDPKNVYQSELSHRLGLKKW